MGHDRKEGERPPWAIRGRLLSYGAHRYRLNWPRLTRITQGIAVVIMSDNEIV